MYFFDFPNPFYGRSQKKDYIVFTKCSNVFFSQSDSFIYNLYMTTTTNLAPFFY